MCVKTDMNFDLTALLSYERAGGQVLVEDILDRLKQELLKLLREIIIQLLLNLFVICKRQGYM